jgi:hypothetical protein
MDMERARCVIEVTAGVVPGKSEDEYTRQYAITEAQWSAAREAQVMGHEQALLAEAAGKAQGYAHLLMLQPNQINWVNVHWLWL